MPKNFEQHLDGKLVDYAVEKGLPVKIKYVTGEEEEGLLLEKLDVYNFLAYNPEKGTTSLIHKANVIKIEITGDISSSISEE